MHTETKPLHKDKILVLASQDQGIKIHLYNKEQAALRARLKIFRLRGLVTERRQGNFLCFKITKETHLL